MSRKKKPTSYAAPEYSAEFTIFGELYDFIACEYRGKSLIYSFNGMPSVKDAMEAQGIPHTEVDVIFVNSRSVDFDYHLQDGDTISLYPTTDGFESDTLVRLHGEPLRVPRFICDVHLGRLARLMRLLGFDTLYRNDYNDREIADTSMTEHRAVLTRDTHLLFRKIIDHGYRLRSQVAQEQLAEVVRRFRLLGGMQPFGRCLSCNGIVASVNKEDILNELEPKTILYYDTFFRCMECGKIYWQGSHFGSLDKIVRQFIE